MAKKKSSAPPPGYAAILMGDNPQAVQQAQTLSPQAQAYIRGIGGGGGGGGGRPTSAPIRQGPSPQSAVASRGTTKAKPKQPAQTPQAKRIASILKPTSDPAKWKAEEAQVQKILGRGTSKLTKGITANEEQIKKKFLDPEIADLEAHGIPADRATELVDQGGITGLDSTGKPTLSKEAQAYIRGISQTDPAAATKTATGQTLLDQVAKTQGGVDPNDPAQAYMAGVLQDAGLPVTASNIRLLEAQAREEGTSAANNPLATSVTAPGSTQFNSAGVQNFPTEAEGEQATAQTLQQKNMASIYNALKSGTATPEDYANALANSAYEGYDPAANAAYAANFLADAGLPDTGFTPSTGAPSTPSTGDGGTGTSGGGVPAPSGQSDAQLIADALGQSRSALTLDPSLLGSISALGGDFFSALGGGQPNTPSGTALTISSPTNQGALAANTVNAPGSPDQTPSQQQMTSIPTGQQIQSALLTLIPNLRPGAASRGA